MSFYRQQFRNALGMTTPLAPQRLAAVPSNNSTNLLLSSPSPSQILLLPPPSPTKIDTPDPIQPTTVLPPLTEVSKNASSLAYNDNDHHILDTIPSQFVATATAAMVATKDVIGERWILKSPKPNLYIMMQIREHVANQFFLETVVCDGERQRCIQSLPISVAEENAMVPSSNHPTTPDLNLSVNHDEAVIIPDGGRMVFHHDRQELGFRPNPNLSLSTPPANIFVLETRQTGQDAFEKCEIKPY